ncbi:MFS transporter [Amycolatopsis jiangsuensis]|uniref:DHA2 family methylenomycin A resistance protein-like MFS transporter n=1 Tax=Amycolatopsis jiangsuensis TaxID=1181879 RepID=A0A840IMX5_9PSEU|nr:MFS transporter [Amycolatopsis jiangsuensis]MBB4682815.1 DHA2 family methylenomycin A resistance protein-like MFS transporter [Amycolatopsis jiangsuensis]
MRSAVLFTLCAGMFLVQLDVTVVNVVLPTLGTQLHADLAGLQWVVDGYSVVLAALLLTGGALGDVLGHRRVVLAGLTVFGAASAACGLAQSAGWLVGARVAQGIGAALVLPGTLAVLTGTFRGRRERARALGIWAGTSALALPAGPLLGGALVTAVGWRPVFWLNVPIVAAAAVATLRLVPPDVRKPGRIDVPGAVSAAVALGAGVYAVIGGTIPVALLAVAAAVAFVVVERRSAQPMLPPALLRSPQTTGANVVSAAMNFVGLGSILVLTLYLQGVLRATPMNAAAGLLPLFVPLAVLGPVSGRLTARFGPLPPMLAGLVLGALGMLNLLRLAPSGGYAEVLPTLLGLGLGMGLLTAAVVTAAVDGAPAGRAGIAGGMNNAARQAGGALGVAVFGAVTGEPDAPVRFVHGLHLLGSLAAGLWLAGVVLAVVCTRRRGSRNPSVAAG